MLPGGYRGGLPLSSPWDRLRAYTALQSRGPCHLSMEIPLSDRPSNPQCAGKIDRRQQIDMFSHVVAEAVEIRSPGQAARQIDHAIVTAMTQKKPVYLDVACNISEEHVSLPIPFQIPPPKPSNAASLRAAVQTTLTQWTHAAKPVIVIGVKVRMVEAFDAVIQLADAAGCAVATMPDAKGMFPEDHPQYIGTYWGPVSSVGAGETVESADMYIFLGSRFNDYNTTGYTCLIKKKGLVTANVDRVETPGGEYGCVNMAEFAVALAKVIPRNDASIKAYTRIFAPEAPVAARPAETLLTMRFVHEQVQNLLTPKTALLVETGGKGTYWSDFQEMVLLTSPCVMRPVFEICLEQGSASAL